MKKIENKLILTNLLIVLLSLLAFFVLVTINITSYTTKSIKEQLKSENLTAARIISMSDKTEGLAQLRFLAESKTFVYSKTANQKNYKLVNRNTNKLKLPDKFLETLLSDLENKIGSTEIDGESYFFTFSYKATRPKTTTGNKTLIVSVISAKDITNLNLNNVKLLGISAIILSIFSFIVTIILSKMITNPIVKLTRISKEYAKRDFSNVIEVKSRDEIGELALSIEEMATNLISYEAEQTKLFRDLSHEVKTPLTSIYGYAEGINGNIFKDNQKASKVIMDESLRIKELLEDIILLNKIESNTESFSFKEENVSDIILESIEKIESIAILNDIDIIYYPNNVSLSCDHQKLLRVFINILSNSLKYTKTTITIETNKTNDEFIISINDDGNGFSKEALDNLDGEQTKGNELGNGIGLLIVDKIIKEHSGQLICKNRQIGASVIIKLPLYKKSS